jgi:hypothetical protein
MLDMGILSLLFIETIHFGKECRMSQVHFTEQRLNEIVRIYLSKINRKKVWRVMSYPQKNLFLKLVKYIYARWFFFGSYIPNQLVDVIPELGIEKKEAYDFVSLLALQLLEQARNDRDEIERHIHTLLVLQLSEFVKMKEMEAAA